MVGRRHLLQVVTAALAAAALAGARAAGKPVRIGYLTTGTPESNAAFLAVFRDALAALGYAVGRDVILVPRYAGDNAGMFPELAATLVKERPDVIVGTCIPSTRAAKLATSTIPVIMSVDGDPVAAGLVTSLARPGGNVTGSSTSFDHLLGKWLELLLIAVPAARTVALLSNPDNAADPYISARFDDAARGRGVSVLPLKARVKQDVERAFVEIGRKRPDGLVAMTEPFLAGQERVIVPLAARHRVPAVYGYREFAEAGGLMSYGLSYREYIAGLARYVDAVLKGRKPADLPVEQPAKIELVVNAPTARALGIALPPALLARANVLLQ